MGMMGTEAGSSLRREGRQSLAVSSACPVAPLETLARPRPNPIDRVPDRRRQARHDPRDRHLPLDHPKAAKHPTRKKYATPTRRSATNNGQNEVHFLSGIDAGGGAPSPGTIRLIPRRPLPGDVLGPR